MAKALERERDRKRKASDAPFETTNPKREVLVAWLEEAARGGCQPKAMRRLCFEAALMLRGESAVNITVTTGETDTVKLGDLEVPVKIDPRLPPGCWYISGAKP